jgi:regulator of protease activity HflC (stomatin/prohibitin superfamily)
MKRTTIIGTAGTVFVLFLLMGATIRVGPDEVGVRTDNFGLSSRGIVQEDFGPGWHLNIPLVHSWNVFPARIRRVEMTKDPRQRSSLGTEALLVQSGDGDRVMLDIDILYRIKPGDAHRVLQDSGVGDGHVRVLMNIARDKLRSVFGKLKTEQFYDPVARYAKSREALEEVRSAVEPRSIEVVDILNQDVEFEPKYEQKIKDKKLADQNVELSKAQLRAAAEKAKVATVNIETERLVKVLQAQAEADAARVAAEANKYSAQKKGEANLYRDQLQAKGDLALARAEARIKQAKTQALMGSGGSNLAALEAVKNLKVDSVQFPTGGRDWFDVREMATRLGARP